MQRLQRKIAIPFYYLSPIYYSIDDKTVAKLFDDLCTL